jgi:hypothetical protein
LLINNNTINKSPLDRSSYGIGTTAPEPQLDHHDESARIPPIHSPIPNEPILDMLCRISGKRGSYRSVHSSFHPARWLPLQKAICNYVHNLSSPHYD